MPVSLTDALDEAVKVVGIIKSQSVSTHVFKTKGEIT